MVNYLPKEMHPSILMSSVTTIIPAYRSAGTICRALDSVFAQTSVPQQVLVVDDGSPDDLAAAIRPYGDRVVLLRKDNGGASSARNYGIDHSRSRFIAFLDADDYWEPTKIELQLAIFEQFPSVGLVASRLFFQNPDEPRQILLEECSLFDRVLTPTGETAFNLATRLSTPSVMVRREVLGEHRFDLTLPCAEDRDLWVRILSSTSCYIINAPLATAVLEPNSLSRSDVDADYGSMMRVIHRHASLLGRDAVRRWEMLTFRMWAAGHLAQGRPRAALVPAWRRLVHQPWSPEGWWVILKAGLLSCAPS